MVIQRSDSVSFQNRTLCSRTQSREFFLNNFYFYSILHLEMLCVYVCLCVCVCVCVYDTTLLNLTSSVTSIYSYNPLKLIIVCSSAYSTTPF